jgi:cytochrome P450
MTAMLDHEELLARFDLFDPDLQTADLWPFFAWLREHHRVARTSALGGVWIVSRQEDLVEILQNPADFSSVANVWPYHENDAIPFNMDPPEHGLFRHVLAPMFGPAEATRMEDSIRATARELLAPIAAAGRCELVRDFARPLPSRAFMDAFAIDPERIPEMIEAAEAAFRLPEGEGGLERLNLGSDAITAYFHDLVQQRRADPSGSDVPSRLVRADVDGRPLTDDEIVNILNLLMAASLDTTTSSLSNMLTWLAEHPDRRDELVAGPSLLPSAIEELLRYEPMLFNGRVVVHDLDFHGTPMKAGDRVMLLFAAAGRDPNVFDDPEAVRFDRTANRHISFGAGPHRCLGIHQARLTLRVAIDEWHRAFPIYRVAPGTTPTRRLTVIKAVSAVEIEVNT